MRKMFPIQCDRKYKQPYPVEIPWSVAEKAYGVYASQYGKSQSLERLAERGGFGPGEMDMFHPQWLEEVCAITRLKTLLRHVLSILEYVSAGDKDLSPEDIVAIRDAREACE